MAENRGGAPGTIMLNFDAVDNKLKELGIKQQAFSKLMGRAPTWYNNAKSQKTKMRDETYRRVKMILGVEDDSLMIKDEPTEIAVPDGFAPSGFETEVLKLLRQIREEQIAQKNLLMYLFNEEQQRHSDTPRVIEKPKMELPHKSELDSAVDILKGLMANTMAIKYQTYQAELGKAKIRNEQIAQAAISKLELQKITRGYGSKKILWIAKKEWIENMKGEE